MLVLASKSEKHNFSKHLSVPNNKPKTLILPHVPDSDKVVLNLFGAFLPDDFSNMSSNFLTIYLQGVTSNLESNETINDELIASAENTKTLTEFWKIPVVDTHDFDTSQLISKRHTFTLNREEREQMVDMNGIIRIMIQSNFNVHMPIKLGYDLTPINRELGIICSAFVLIFLYVLIIWEVSESIYFQLDFFRVCLFSFYYSPKSKY